MSWQGEPLPRGRHKLAPEVVRASQRSRLMRAMLESVGEHGYAATTVPKVVAAARVSRNAFYEHFTDKTDCFIAVCDEAAGELLDEMFALASEPDWVLAVQTGTRRYLQWWQDRPAFSRAYFLELPAAGERALDQRDRAYQRFRQMFLALAGRAREQQPDLPELSPIVPRVLVSAITELIAEEVRAGRIGRLTELSDDVAQLMLTLLADEQTARGYAAGGRLSGAP